LRDDITHRSTSTRRSSLQRPVYTVSLDNVSVMAMWVLTQKICALDTLKLFAVCQSRRSGSIAESITVIASCLCYSVERSTGSGATRELAEAARCACA